MADIAAERKVPWFPWVGKKRPFYGWVVVAVGSVTQFSQGVTGQGFATYLGPLQKEFGWSKALLAGPRSASQVENAVLGPIEGILVDRLGPRFMVALGTLIMGTGLIMFGLVNSLWMYFLANIVISIGASFQGMLVVSVVVNHWFRRKRTVAQSVMLLGFSAAGVVGIPALVWTQGEWGWRASAIISGVFLMAIGIPGALLIRREPEAFGLAPDGDPPRSPHDLAREGRPALAEEPDFTLGEAIRTRTFWLLAVGNGLSSLAIGAMSVHLFLHLEQGVGLTRGTAALVWTAASITNIPCRLAGGIVGDRLPKHLVLGAATALVALSLMVLGLATSLPLALAYAVLYGIAWGVRTPVANALQGEYFGRKSQGLIRGSLQSLALPLSIAGPVAAGAMADRLGDYRVAFVSLSVVGLAGAVCIFLATRPRPPLRPQGPATAGR